MYNGNLEWSLTIRDFQSDPEFFDGPQDLQTAQDSIDAMQSAPLGEPSAQYDARAVYDSRPVNAFDGLFSGSVDATNAAPWVINFEAPLGYRVVPREWQVSYDAPGSGPLANSQVTILLQGAALPYNGPLTIGPGTTDPIETFYVVEEGATFGMSGVNTNIAAGGTTAYVNVRVNLIPVTLDQLSYAVENRKPGT